MILAVKLPQPLADYYFDYSRASGKTVSDLIVHDLEQYHEQSRYVDKKME
jgi:hypothetical protein